MERLTRLARRIASRLGGGAPSSEGAATDLVHRLDRRLGASGLPESSYGIAVLRRGPASAVVFAKGHEQALRPASVAKVFTAAAALDLLGPSHLFTTTLTARGTVNPQGTLHGDLVVHGTGDSTVSGRLHGGEPTRILDILATSVSEAGIRRVAGALVLDDGPYDRAYLHPSWPLADPDRSDLAGVAGLMFNDSCIHVRVKGANVAGQPASIDVPSTLGPWTLDARVETRRARGADVNASWTDCGERVLVRGRVARRKVRWLAVPARDPLLFFGHALLSRLEHGGVHVLDGVRPARDASDRKAGPLLVAQHASPLDFTLRVMNGYSQNAYAGILFKTLGVATEDKGSWDSGQRAVATVLRRRGLDPAGVTRIVDGSGVSLENRTTAETVARLLLAFDEDPSFSNALRESLAVPGRAGTLRKRLTQRDLPRRLHAKTGTHQGVQALAGYVDGRLGEPGYAFAILLNDARAEQALVDSLLTEIAR